MAKPKTLLGVMQQQIRVRQLSRYTEKQYLGWVRRYLRFHQKKHPREVGIQGIVDYLSHLSTNLNVSPSTQNQALNALVFLYRNVLEISLGEMKNIAWAKQHQNVPVVLTSEEVAKLLNELRPNPIKWTIASLLYGTGLRPIEALRLKGRKIDQFFEVIQEVTRARFKEFEVKCFGMIDLSWNFVFAHQEW